MDWSPFVTPTIGATGLLAFAVWLIFRGSLVPSRVVEQMRKDKDEQIAMWKNAYELSERASTKKDRQIDTLLEAARTTTHVVSAMSEAVGLDAGGHRHALAPNEE